MSARHALLGLLLDRPGYPYDLGERLQRRLGPAWRVNSGQLYQDIEWLRNKGLIERVADQPSREGRHVYAITDDGIDAFETWLNEVGDGPRPTRRPLLAKVTLAGPARIRRTLEQIDAYQRDRVELLAELLRQEAAIADDETPVRADQVLLRLNLSADIFALQAELRWARRAHDVILLLLEHDEVVWPSSSPVAVAGGRSRSRNARKDLFARMSSKRVVSDTEGGDAQGETEPSSAGDGEGAYRHTRSS
jgi:PadR family transcriptional regulator, regulatory protein AphA